MKKTVSVYNTSPYAAGKSGVYKKAPRRDLERTLMDYLTWGDNVDFCEAQEIVEDLATHEELIEMIWNLQNGLTTAPAIMEAYGY